MSDITVRRTASLFLAALVVGFLALENWRAHRPGDVRTTRAQLGFLEQALDEGAAEQMQAVFPEGFVFTWALYGLASAQVARVLPVSDSGRAHLLSEARRAIDRLRSPEARSTFDAELAPPYGAFYQAWSLYVMAEYVRAAGPDEAPRQLLESFERRCAQLAGWLDRSDSPFLPSYSGSAWPADTAVGVAALGIHDSVLGRRYGDTIARWVAKARLRLDPELGALSHEADPRTGAPRGGVRGSSLALMSRVLVEADPELAMEQYVILREHFVDHRWGVVGVREYPRGHSGHGDIDSGPIVLGMSGPALVVGAAAARVHGEESLADILLGAVEVAGLPIEIGGRRRYAGGLAPVGDAFIAWARSAPVTVEADWIPIVPEHWAVPAHGLSVAIAVLVCVAVARPLASRRSRREGAAARRAGFWTKHTMS